MDPAVASLCTNIHICGISIQFNMDQVSSSFSSMKKEEAVSTGIGGEIEPETHVERGISSGISYAICLFECDQTGCQEGNLFSSCLLNSFTWEWGSFLYDTCTSALNFFGACVTDYDCLPYKNYLWLRQDLRHPGNQIRFNTFSEIKC